MAERRRSTDTTRQRLGRRIASRLTAAVDEIGRFVVTGPGGAGAAIGGRPASDHPPVRQLWIEHDARRDDLVQPLAPIEAAVADGLLVAHVAVRMAVKNHVLVAALRDRLDFDPRAIGEFARGELLRLADENDELAERLTPIVDALPAVGGRSLTEQVERERQVRRPRTHRAVADALRRAPDEPGLLEAIVRQAAGDAADEFGRAVAAAIAPVPDLDPDAGARRIERTRLLIEEDLRALRRATRTRSSSRRGRVTTRRGG